MSTKSKIAALAALVTVIAAPALAGDQDLATELQDSGRYFGIASGAYASVNVPAQIQAPRTWAPVRQNDFQLQGR